MAATLRIDTLTTPDGTGNITLSRPIAGDGSNLTGILPAVGSDGNVLTSDGTNWSSTAPAGGGKLLQVQQNSSNASQGITTTETDVTGSSITITPVAAGSSFLYVFDSHGYSNTNPMWNYYTIKRDGTLIKKNAVISKQNANDDHERLDINMSVLDATPSYTLGNTLTYKLTVKADNQKENTMNIGPYTKGTHSYIMEIGA